MKSYFSDALVEVPTELVAQMTNHEGDRHVLAAAVQAEAQIIVTFNLKHFSSASTQTWGIEAQHPDLFLLDLLEENSSLMVNVIKEQAARLRKPTFSLSELLDGLAKQAPQFVSAFREFL